MTSQIDYVYMQSGRLFQPPDYNSYITTTLFLLIFLFGFIANLLVMVTLCNQATKTVTNQYFFTLAMVDFFFNLCIPFNIITKQLKGWLFGAVICKIYYILHNLNQFSSSFLLAMLAFDRYLAVCHSVKAIRYRSVNKARCIIFGTLTTSFLAVLPISMFATEIRQFVIFNDLHFKQFLQLPTLNDSYIYQLQNNHSLLKETFDRLMKEKQSSSIGEQSNFCDGNGRNCFPLSKNEQLVYWNKYQWSIMETNEHNNSEFILQRYYHNLRIGSCQPIQILTEIQSVFYTFIISYLIPIIFIVIFYWKVGKKIWCLNKKWEIIISQRLGVNGVNDNSKRQSLWNRFSLNFEQTDREVYSFSKYICCWLSSNYLSTLTTKQNQSRKSAENVSEEKSTDYHSPMSFHQISNNRSISHENSNSSIIECQNLERKFDFNVLQRFAKQSHENVRRFHQSRLSAQYQIIQLIEKMDEVKSTQSEPIMSESRNLNKESPVVVKFQKSLRKTKIEKKCELRRSTVAIPNDILQLSLKNRRQARRKVTQTAFIVIIVYIVCWLPYWMSNFSIIYLPMPMFHQEILIRIKEYCQILAYVNSAVNPILYAFLSDAVRTTFLHSLRKFFKYFKCLY
ncbi:hypothetical protein SNEBB_000870 [Seison nebaliae]|nr:hypothetical protein SNEBB_000870 [Seison nebaliae]